MTPGPALQRAAAMTVEDYDPRVVIEAVNALQPLGKADALAAIEQTVESRAGEESTGLFWVLRTLFDTPGVHPRVGIGDPDVAPPAYPEQMPRWPIVLVGDVPLLVVGGYFLGGLPEGVSAHADVYRREGSIRERPLHPPASADGLAEQFRALWEAAYGDEQIGEVAPRVDEQLDRAGLR